MKRSLVDILRLSTQDSPVELYDFGSGGQEVDYAVLRCPESGRTHPVLSGFPLFTEALPVAPEPYDLHALKTAEDELFGAPLEYAHFVEQKWRRPHRDAYAAFQPFNESTRAFYPLVPLLRERLQPGDYILDTWCRTGWSGELLAALFPEQRVVSIWEGNQGVLSYRAFRYWLDRDRRAGNLEILFHDVNQPFPFKSQSFAAVVGLDTLHRYDADNLVAECQRICRDDGPVLFPHVHLTNSEPDPWFDRGCRQEHGQFWNEYLNQAAENTTRSVLIESEMALFTSSANAVVANNPQTSHYNALAGLIPREWEGAPLSSIDDQFSVHSNSYIMINPLLDIDLNRLRVGLRTNDADGMTEHMLLRHPGYGEFLSRRLCAEIDADQARVLYWASKAMPLGYIAEQLNLTTGEIQQILAPLVAADIALILPVSTGMAHLNHYYANQLVAVLPDEQNLAALWKKAVRDYGDDIYVVSIEDELELTYAELNQLVEITAGRLLAQLPQAGAPVCVAAEPKLETVLLFWAAQLVGSPFAAIDPGWPVSRIAEIIQQHDFELLFIDTDIPRDVVLPKNTTVISLESESVSAGRYVQFEDWLEDETAVSLPEAEPLRGSAAVILFTSGTTGVPKGVALAHQAVWQSAVSFAHYYEWSRDDVYLGLGHYATMSGLRNPLVATATVGCRFLIPDACGRSGVLEAVSMMGNQGATIMGVVPAFLTRLASLAQRLEPTMFASLRLFLCTAANLQPSVVDLVEGALGVTVSNYYGLTETCGACIFMPREKPSETANYIGKPFDAIAQIVTGDGRVAHDNEPGELRIYSGNLMTAYLNEPSRSSEILRDGWLYTGDICRRSTDGVIELRGRKRDVIKASSGTLIYLAEVEQCLCGQSGTSDLAVVGFVDDHGDDQLACFLEAIDETAADSLLAQFNALLRMSLSPDHQLSTVIHVESLPRGANEKILKGELVRQHFPGIGESQ